MLTQKHIIYDLLEEYSLNNPQSLHEAIRRLAQADWYAFFDRLDKWYEERLATKSQPSLDLTPTTFCFPVLPSSRLDNISSHLLISDKVFLDDPLYDVVAILGDLVTDAKAQAVTRYSHDKLYEETEKYIRFYLRGKELVDEGHLILFKQPPLISQDGAEAFFNALTTTLGTSKELWRMWGFRFPPAIYQLETVPTYLLWKIRNKGSLDDFLREWVPSKRIQEIMTITTLSMCMIESLAAFAVSGGLHGLSTDFITRDIAFLFRRCLEAVDVSNRQLPENRQILFPGTFSKQAFNLPLLCDVPIERVLDTILISPETFEIFRSSINEKLSSISAPPGSHEREQQIVHMQDQIRSDVEKIEVSYRSIQDQFRRKWAMNLLFGSFSVIVTGLSATTHNLDALTIAGTIAGTAGITTSVKEIAKEWLEYQAELSKLRTNDNFFIWRLLSKQGSQRIN